jgi:hypothetical protein
VPVAVVAAVLAVVLTSAGGPAPITFAASTVADPADGAAYATEAIDNLRGMERFRFTQTVAGAGSKANPASGRMDGEVDLASSPSDRPRLRSKVHLESTDGADVTLEAITIDDEVHVKGPKEAKFKPSKEKAQKTRGKNAGRSADVAVIDPVMQLLEPIDTMPAAAFSPASDVIDGVRTVTVGLPEGASVVLIIDDATRLLQRIEFTNGPKSAVFTLADFGATDIDIQAPSS